MSEEELQIQIKEIFLEHFSISGLESSGDLEASGLCEGRSPVKKKAKLDSSQLDAGVDTIAQQEVPKKNVAEIEVDHCIEDFDPEDLDYEPEAEEESVVNEEVECSVDDVKVNDANKQASLREVCKLEEATKEGRSETGKNCELKEQPNRAKATSSDEKNVGNQTEPGSAMLIQQSKGSDANYDCSKLEDKSEPKKVCGRIDDLQNFESTTVNEKVAREAAIKAAEESNKDLFNFTRLPVKVREPLKLPRHAAGMLSSGRPMSPILDCAPDSPIPPQSPPCALSDVSESDSELESLASECSTMTAVSELSMGDEDIGGGDAPGKIKRRGMKKKRKDRRRLHGGKCSKEQHR